MSSKARSALKELPTQEDLLSAIKVMDFISNKDNKKILDDYSKEAKKLDEEIVFAYRQFASKNSQISDRTSKALSTLSDILKSNHCNGKLFSTAVELQNTYFQLYLAIIGLSIDTTKKLMEIYSDSKWIGEFAIPESRSHLDAIKKKGKDVLVKIVGFIPFIGVPAKSYDLISTIQAAYKIDTKEANNIFNKQCLALFRYSILKDGGSKKIIDFVKMQSSEHTRAEEILDRMEADFNRIIIAVKKDNA